MARFRTERCSVVTSLVEWECQARLLLLKWNFRGSQYLLCFVMNFACFEFRKYVRFVVLLLIICISWYFVWVYFNESVQFARNGNLRATRTFKLLLYVTDTCENCYQSNHFKGMVRYQHKK